ncbi:2S seed storage protein-like [Silene latifolia]|uniref:2S seed storage protein-like n=1 Tax=Silene latifolia TaxID=37657 RepID=UPI003D76E0D8
MASKLVILAATVAAMVVLTQATFQTTVITTELENEHGGSGQCRQQLRGQWPDQCQKFMMQGMMRRQLNPSRSRGGRECLFDMCCEEMEMMEPQCQCEAMKMMVQEMRPMSQSHPQMMMEKAMMIPMFCGTMQRKCSMSTM